MKSVCFLDFGVLFVKYESDDRSLPRHIPFPFQKSHAGNGRQNHNFLSVATQPKKITLMKDWPAETFSVWVLRRPVIARLHGAGQARARNFARHTA